MKTQAISKIKTIQNRIRKIIKLVERENNIKNIIIENSKAKKMLLSVKNLLLRDRLIKISKEKGISEKEVLDYYNLMN